MTFSMPNTLISNVPRNASSDRLSNDPCNASPALFTTTSTPPNAAIVASTARRTLRSSARSTDKGRNCPSSLAPTASSNASPSRAVAATL
ncbi:hypothetical protein G6F35_018514 [Rhizopus arrhizus]|nr:hypothetical protein G6F35_018514 [Rhizopus arrhizus]